MNFTSTQHKLSVYSWAFLLFLSPEFTALCIFWSFGHSCLVPSAVSCFSCSLSLQGHMHITSACPELCSATGRLSWLKDNAKSLLRAASAVLIWECWCMGGGPTAAPGSRLSNTAAALQLCTAHWALQPPLELQSLHPKSLAMLPFTAVSQWSNSGTVREKKAKKPLRNRETHWGVICRCCKLFSF